MELFNSFKTNKELINQTEFVNVYSVKYEEKEYTIIIPKKRANNKTIIHFVDNTIFWEQIPRFPKLAGKQYGDRIPIYKFDAKVLNTLFVLKGNPLGDEGLDNGIYRSFKKYDENCVNCITYNKFKNVRKSSVFRHISFVSLSSNYTDLCDYKAQKTKTLEKGRVT